MAGLRSLHELVEDALERAAHVHEDSYDLVMRQRAVEAALHDTVRRVREGRRRRATFGNGHRLARGRSRPG